jgi:hypothetical protein
MADPVAAGGAARPGNPDPGGDHRPVRYRCAACGNVTRFDVVSTRRTRAFHHFTVGGELTVEEEQVLAEDIEEVTCRWCGHGRAVEPLTGAPNPDPGEGVTARP